jgi:mannosyltransferase OCH1-like enzyme
MKYEYAIYVTCIFLIISTIIIFFKLGHYLKKEQFKGNDEKITIQDKYITSFNWNKQIPNTIYQTYKTNQISRKMYERTVDIVLDLNSNCNYKFYSDEKINTFIQDEYDIHVLNIFNKLTIGAAKGDLFRYLILYKFGGIYCDLDNVVTKSFEKYLRDDDKFVVLRNENDRIDMHVFCVIPKHPLLKQIIDKTLYNIEHYTGTQKTGHVTGPFMYRPIVEEYMRHNSDVRVVDENHIVNKMREKIKKYEKDYVYWGIIKKI